MTADKKTPPPPDAPEFWKAVGAAVADQAKAQFVPVADDQGHPPRPHEWFTRAHVAMLRDLGCTRADILDYAASKFNPVQVAKLAADLPSYGIH